MQPADASTVLGDFDDATFTYHDVTSTFFRRSGGYWVQTDDPDGKLHEYRIALPSASPRAAVSDQFPGGAAGPQRLLGHASAQQGAALTRFRTRAPVGAEWRDFDEL
jgi:hypothetical protein